MTELLNLLKFPEWYLALGIFHLAAPRLYLLELIGKWTVYEFFEPLEQIIKPEEGIMGTPDL